MLLSDGGEHVDEEAPLLIVMMSTWGNVDHYLRLAQVTPHAYAHLQLRCYVPFPHYTLALASVPILPGAAEPDMGYRGHVAEIRR